MQVIKQPGSTMYANEEEKMKTNPSCISYIVKIKKKKKQEGVEHSVKKEKSKDIQICLYSTDHLEGYTGKW